MASGGAVGSSRTTAAKVCAVLPQRFGVHIAPSAMSAALQRHNITWKRRMHMDERGFNEEKLELTSCFYGAALLWTSATHHLGA